MQPVDPTRPDPSTLTEAQRIHEQEIENEVRNERVTRMTNDSGFLATLLGLFAVVVIVLFGASYMMRGQEGSTDFSRTSTPITGNKSPSGTPTPAPTTTPSQQ